MPVFDASSMMYAWDNYPESQFPPLWNWIESEINNNRLSMPSVAVDEVGHKAPDCKAWLIKRHFKNWRLQIKLFRKLIE